MRKSRESLLDFPVRKVSPGTQTLRVGTDPRALLRRRIEQVEQSSARRELEGEIREFEIEVAQAAELYHTALVRRLHEKDGDVYSNSWYRGMRGTARYSYWHGPTLSKT